ncbi:hypothetical protein SAMN04487950_4422 [Halogranum rubrum]|uniref:DUF8186 domain-containing protein n=1 Tax=Halogranum rubrum TaxID=553466 RepID=A0A1I4JAN4_9EURY|nr:hypothetical protein [Halogranum rubrum]SFL63271.1 hypothetical protein SAMN04487950_4422 [Halogranum rubrum]
MTDSLPLTGLVVVALLALPVVSAVTAPTGTAPNNGTRAFISDDRDPNAGTLPPFVLSTLDDVVRAENVSVANISRMRDFSYATTQPPYRVGPNQQTLREYRLAQLNSIQRNDSTSLWLPDSQRSNGTVVKDAHITILGTNEGVRTGMGASEGNRSENASGRLLIPRNGTVLTQLDYSTLLPNQTCTVAGDTKTCLSYDLLEQQVDRSVRIGNQTWESDSAPPRQLEYDGASATEPTTMQVRATINSTVAVTTKTYVRDGGGWQLSNTTADETLTLSHTVQDSAPVVVTTNQDLSVTQTIVRSEDGIDRIILRFEGPQTLSDRRLWSYARFKGSAGRVQNVWGVYSQRRYTNATRGRRLLTTSNTTLSPSNTTRLNQTLAQQLAVTDGRQRTVPFPNVLELRLTARSRQPTLRWTQNTSVTAAPEITRLNGFNMSGSAAPLDRRVNLSSAPPRGYTTIVITNVDQPITEVRDIHNDSIPLTTQTVREQNASLSATTLNETHARIQLTDSSTGQPLAGRTLWLSGAAQGRVMTNVDGAVVVERRDLYVTASFTGATNVSENVYYGPAQTRVAFQPEPFNIYQLLTSLAGALVSVAAFLVFFAPFAYMRRGTG